jgi:hypothetical protein
MKRWLFDVRVTDPSGLTVSKKIFAESEEQAGARAIERAKMTSQLPIADRRYGDWTVFSAMPTQPRSVTR